MLSHFLYLVISEELFECLSSLKFLIQSGLHCSFDYTMIRDDCRVYVSVAGLLSHHLIVEMQ